MSTDVLRRSDVLPLINPYTVSGGMVFFGIWIWVWLQFLMDPQPIHSLYFLSLLQLFPVVLAFTRKHFTYMSFIMMFHFFSLSFPRWFQFNGYPGVPPLLPMAVEAINEQIFCTSVMLLVYFGCRSLLFNARPEKEKYLPLTLRKWQVVLLGLYVVLVPAFVDRLPSWFLTVHFLLLSADFVMLFSCHSPGNEILVRFVKFAAFLESIEYFLTTGMMTLMVALLSFYFLVICIERRYRLLVPFLLCIGFLSAVQTIKGSFRAIIFKVNPELSLIGRVELIGELLAYKYFDNEELEFDEDEEEKNALQEKSSFLLSGFMRASDDSLERVMELTPSKIDYWGGETYASIPFMFIPRALWPDKPSRHFWNKYGRTYGVLSSDDHQTSVGVSYLAEGYMNFGYHGMYFVALLMGFIIAICEAAAHRVLGGYFLFPFIIFLTPLLSPGTDLGSVLQSLWVLTLFMVGARPTLLGMAQRDDYV